MKMIPFSIVVAVDEKFGIGRQGGLPWNLPGDLKHFKEVTMQGGPRQNIVIMGRKTWESIPPKFRPLPGRINLVLTRDPAIFFPNAIRALDLEDALALTTKPPLKDTVGDIYVIGGGEVFNTAIRHPACQKLFITHVQQSYDCDRFFPAIPSAFKETARSQIFQEGGICFFFSTYNRV